MTTETDMFAQARNRQNLRPGPEAKALDMWMQRSLGERFNDTLTDGMPDELAALVARFSA